MKGKVEWFSGSYGFILGDDGESYFVHFSAIIGEGENFKNLRDGQSVEFKSGKNDKGFVAENVKIIKE